jgi:hypothetical protein
MVGVEIELAKDDGNNKREGVAGEGEELEEETEEAWSAAGDDVSVAFTGRRWTTVIVTTEAGSSSA